MSCFVTFFVLTDMQPSERRWRLRLWINTTMESSSESQQEPEKTLVSKAHILKSHIILQIHHVPQHKGPCLYCLGKKGKDPKNCVDPYAVFTHPFHKYQYSLHCLLLGMVFASLTGDVLLFFYMSWVAMCLFKPLLIQPKKPKVLSHWNLCSLKGSPTPEFGGKKTPQAIWVEVTSAPLGFQ